MASRHLPHLLLAVALVAACDRAPAVTATARPDTAAAAVTATPALYTPLPPVQQDSLAPGEFRWQPERVPEGPVLIVVSLDEQMAYVYRNGVEIARSTVSSGRAGHETPTGVFQILQKERRHHSNLYNSAPMPYMERLTWDGIALHAGKLPGYPASHGCIRLPFDFAKVLYDVTANGGTVVIADEAHGGANLAHPGFVAPQLAVPVGDAPAASERWSWHPERADSGPVAIVVSSASRYAHVLRNGVEIGRAPIQLSEADRPLIPVTYVRTDVPANRPNPFAPDRPLFVWTMVGARDVDSTAAHQLTQRVKVPPEFATAAFDVLHTGAVIVVTDEPLEPARRSDADFTIVAADRDLAPTASAD